MRRQLLPPLGGFFEVLPVFVDLDEGPVLSWRLSDAHYSEKTCAVSRGLLAPLRSTWVEADKCRT
jgi:hypothetical protein